MSSEWHRDMQGGPHRSTRPFAACEPLVAPTASDLYFFMARQEAAYQEEMTSLGDTLIMEESTRGSLASMINSNHAKITQLEGELLALLRQHRVDVNAMLQSCHQPHHAQGCTCAICTDGDEQTLFVIMRGLVSERLLNEK